MPNPACAPYELAKTVFFVFLKILDHKVRKSRTRVGHANFSLDSDDFIFLNYCYWVRKHTQVPFSPDCSFKICVKPSKFSKSVYIVLSVSAYSLTMPTPCLHSQDYTNIVSAQSTTTTTPCPRSQRLCRHLVCVINDFAEIMSVLSTTISACVLEVNDYVDSQFLKISNYIFCYIVLRSC